MIRVVLSTLLLLAAVPAVFAQAPIDLKGKTLAETFTELLPKMSAPEAPARKAAQQQWQDLCFRISAPDGDKLRTEACTLMAASLNEKTPAEGRIWLLVQLARIGREESVDAIAAQIDDKDDVVRDNAVRALANNPSPTATAKMAEKLAASTKKVGLINALGHRKDPAAVPAIAKELGGEADVAVAAARALGRIPGDESAKALSAARASAKGPVKNAIADALLIHADRYLKAGKTAEANDICIALRAAEEIRPVRLAALRGLIQAAGDNAGELVLKVLAGQDAAEQAVAVGQIETLTAGALKTLSTSIDKLPVPSRVLIVSAIAARGDRTLLPVAVAAVKSSEAEVRRAGMLALGRLGDATVVDALLEVMSGKDPLAGVAVESIAQLTADGVDAKLIAALAGEKTPAKSVVLISLLERRKASSAVPELLKSATGDDAAVRNAAMSALKVLATPEHIPGMVVALLKTAKGPEREQAELAIATVAAQNPKADKRADAVLDAIKNAKERTADLLPLLGRLGGPEALKVLREALAGTEPALRTAALAGYSHWPDVTANEDLLAMAEKEKEAADRLTALKALIRVNTAPGERTQEERLAALAVMKKAMTLATRDDERREIISGLGFIRTLDTLHYVLPYLDQAPLSQAACKGVVELAHSKTLREPNKAEFDKALDRVISLTKDKTLIDRAKQYKEGR